MENVIACLKMQFVDDSPSGPTYRAKRQRLLEGWSSIRDVLLSVRIEEMAPPTDRCTMCNNHQTDIVKCSRCGPSAFYCNTCMELVHQHVLFHQPLKWNNAKQMYIPVMLTTTLARRDGHDCGTLYTTDILAIDSEGKQYQCKVQLCRCEQAAVTFLRYALWPATPSNPKVAFSIRFMELLSVLQLECHLPAKSFCQALTCMRSYNLELVADEKDVYRAVVGDALAEYNYHRSSMNTRHNITTSTIGRECPICEKEPEILSLDGNFGLVHKASSGKGHGQEGSRHQNLFFGDHSSIKDFISSYCTDRKSQTNECSDFQAGNVVRSKTKSGKLDITGVFGSVCKHDVPFMFLDMFHGERLGYPVYILDKVLQRREGKLIVMYDIACSLKQHLEKNNQQDILEVCDFAVPVFHSFAHNTACQLEYGQRYKAGTGMTDGEGIERLWSYLRNFKKITKEMNLNNRQDLLSEALLHHTDRVLWNIPSRFVDRLMKANTVIQDCSSEVAEIVHTYNESEDVVEEWHGNWKRSAAFKAKQDKELSSTELYVESLDHVRLERSKLETCETEAEKIYQRKEIERKEKESRKLQKKAGKTICLNTEAGQSILSQTKAKRRVASLSKLKSLATERQYFSSLMRKYAGTIWVPWSFYKRLTAFPLESAVEDGQGIGIRVSRAFTTNSSKIKKELDLLNSYNHEKVDQATVSSPSAPIYNELETGLVTASQQKAISAYFQILHAKEEIEKVKDESFVFLQYLITQSQKLQEFIHPTSNVLNRMDLGKRIFCLSQHLYLEKIWDICKPIIQRFEFDLQMDHIVYDTILESVHHEESTASFASVLEDIGAFEIEHKVFEAVDESDDELQDLLDMLEENI